MAQKVLILIEGSKFGTGLLYAQAAQSLGLHPITLSTDPARYEYLGTEGLESIHVDTGSLEALIHVCSRLHSTYDIVGITGFPSPGEAVLATVGKLCGYFGLPGANPASIEQCCDKFTQRQLLADAGVPIPAYRLAANAGDVKRATVEIGLPVVLKPAVGCGSSGVRLCSTVDEVAEHTRHLLGGTHIWRSPPQILVEEFAQGPHYTAQIMGKEVIGITTSDFGPPPHFVYRQFTFPAPLAAEEHERIEKVALSSLQALGLGWGPTNIELRWTKRGPVVIEVNPRMAGTPDPELVQLAYGVDLVTEHVKLVTGDERNSRKLHAHTAAARILVPDRDGTLDWTDGPSRAAAIPGVAEVKLYVKPKTPIVRKGDDRDWIGYIIASSPSLAQTEAILQSAVDLIGWSITPFPTLDE